MRWGGDFSPPYQERNQMDENLVIDENTRKKPGPKPKIKSEEMDFDNPISAVEARRTTTQRKEKARKKILAEREKGVYVIGWAIIPYFNRPKKANKFCKLALRQGNKVSGTNYQRLIGKNVPLGQAQKLMTNFVMPKDIIAEHLRRSKTPNYGFSVNG